MKYFCFAIDTTTEAEDVIAYMLSDRLGIDSVEFDDNEFVDDSEKEGGFFPELQPDTPADDGTSVVKFYMPGDTDADEMASKVTGVLSELKKKEESGEGIPVGTCTLHVTTSDDKDWRDKWKDYFHAFTIGDLLIRPSWEEAPADLPHTHELEIDPGVAFGTGAHESTRLCIEGLQKYLKEGDRVLDLGTGSGILAIVALLYGASHVTGTDIDPDCTDTCYENLEKNHLSKEDFDVYIGNLTEDRELQDRVGYGAYDVVTANILADIIIPMAPAAYRAIKKDGIFISSGIINFRKGDVREALEKAGFTVLDEVADGEWFSIVCRK